MYKRKCNFLLLTMMLAALLGGCSLGGKKPDNGEYLKFEHKISDPPATDTPKKEPIGDPNATPTPTPTAPLSAVDGQKFTPVNDEVFVSATKLNLRKGPGTTYDVVVMAKSGEVFTRIGKGDKEWDQLLYKGETVYAVKKYIEQVEGSSKPEDKKAEGDQAMEGLNIVDISTQKYSYDTMKKDLEALNDKYPGLMKLNKLASTKDGRFIYDAVIGNASSGKNIIIQASIHAREYMTAQLVMKQLEYYLANAESGSYNGTNYKELFQLVAIHIIPMTNPDGVMISQNGEDGISSQTIRGDLKKWYDRDVESGTTKAEYADYLLRFKANANGVDLNRNFNYGWEEYKGAAVPGAERYKGTSPGSEPETAALVALTEQLKPVASISYHASGSVLYWDYGQSGALKDSCKKLVDLLHEVTGYEIKYAATDPQDSAGYGDWVVMKKKIPSVTIEIGKGSAPLSASEFEAIFKENYQVFAAMAENYK